MQKIFFDTRAAALHLSDLGVKISPRSLEKWRTSGAGPRFRKVGPGPRARVVYALDDLLIWLDDQSRSSTATAGSTAKRSGEHATKAA